MNITREQVADLQPGDVVRLVQVCEDGSRYIFEGPVRADGGSALVFADWWLRTDTGDVPEWVDELTVVSRAPRPLYVNHDRTEPVTGDVVRDGEGVVRWVARVATGVPSYWSHDYQPSSGWTHHRNPPKPLTLLVDGKTGQIVL